MSTLLLAAPCAVLGQQTHTGNDTAAPSSPPADERSGGEFKLTFGRYNAHDASVPDGSDVNLRYRRDDTTWWGGLYHDADFGNQARGGFDTRWKPWVGHDVAVLPAVMAATRGFMGGSLVVEVGSPFYVQMGLGRTNLKPFVNLNFDPNDAVTLAAGYRPDVGGSYGMTIVRDNRTGSGQQDIHLTGQWQLQGHERLTVDLLHKTGQGDDGHVRANGATITYDFPRWFARLAYDPKQNFGPVDVTRLSVGLWF